MFDIHLNYMSDDVNYFFCKITNVSENSIIILFWNILSNMHERAAIDQQKYLPRAVTLNIENEPLSNNTSLDF